MSSNEISQYLDCCTEEYVRLMRDYDRDGGKVPICHMVLEVTTDMNDAPDDCIEPVYRWVTYGE